MKDDWKRRRERRYNWMKRGLEEEEVRQEDWKRRR